MRYIGVEPSAQLTGLGSDLRTREGRVWQSLYTEAHEILDGLVRLNHSIYNTKRIKKFFPAFEPSSVKILNRKFQAAILRNLEKTVLTDSVYNGKIHEIKTEEDIDCTLGENKKNVVNVK